MCPTPRQRIRLPLVPVERRYISVRRQAQRHDLLLSFGHSITSETVTTTSILASASGSPITPRGQARWRSSIRNHPSAIGVHHSGKVTTEGSSRSIGHPLCPRTRGGRERLSQDRWDAPPKRTAGKCAGAKGTVSREASRLPCSHLSTPGRLGVGDGQCIEARGEDSRGGYLLPGAASSGVLVRPYLQLPASVGRANSPGRGAIRGATSAGGLWLPPMQSAKTDGNPVLSSSTPPPRAAKQLNRGDLPPSRMSLGRRSLPPRKRGQVSASNEESGRERPPCLVRRVAPQVAPAHGPGGRSRPSVSPSSFRTTSSPACRRRGREREPTVRERVTRQAQNVVALSRGRLRRTGGTSCRPRWSLHASGATRRASCLSRAYAIGTVRPPPNSHFVARVAPVMPYPKRQS